MTIERPMFPPRAESVDSFSRLPAIGQGERESRVSESCKPAERLSRRGVLAGVASAAALPIVAAVLAASAKQLDAELIELGAKFEPLVDQYYKARKPWARSMVAAHAARDRDFGVDQDYTPEHLAALAECCRRSGVDEAAATLHAAYEDMEPLMEAINAAPVNSIEGLRAKALVALYEIAPLCAWDTEFTFDRAHAFQQIFTAVAELCGLQGKMAATGYEMPDIGMDDDETDDAGEEA
jgi:hypothetical protein